MRTFPQRGKIEISFSLLEFFTDFVESIKVQKMEIPFVIKTIITFFLTPFEIKLNLVLAIWIIMTILIIWRNKVNRIKGNYVAKLEQIEARSIEIELENTTSKRRKLHEVALLKQKIDCLEKESVFLKSVISKATRSPIKN